MKCAARIGGCLVALEGGVGAQKRRFGTGNSLALRWVVRERGVCVCLGEGGDYVD